jgi:hypothetical protein
MVEGGAGVAPLTVINFSRGSLGSEWQVIDPYIQPTP